jgi:tetratricopeptide (TPR) repeat protein
MRRVTMVAVLVVALGLGGTVATSLQLDKLHDQIAMQEVLYLPSAKTVRAISLGYTGLMADIYWTRVVQYFGRKHMEDSQSYKLLPPLLSIATDLDPKLIIAYQFGAFFLSQKPPQGAGSPDDGIALVQKGIANNPTYWRLYYDLGFIYWLEKKDFNSAAHAFATGAEIPGALPWMRTIAGSMALGADNLDMARTLWQEVLKDSKDPTIQANARTRLVCINSDEAVIELQKRVDLYKERTGRVPSSFREIAEAGLVRGIPNDPAGNPYLIDAKGHVLVKDHKSLPFITKGLPEGEKPEIFYNKWKIEEHWKQVMEERKKAEQQKSSDTAARPKNEQ